MGLVGDRYEGEFGGHKLELVVGLPLDADAGIEIGGNPLPLRKTS